MVGRAWMNFMKRIPRWTYARTPQGMRPTRRTKAAHSIVFFYPDCEETVASFQPSAPASDRIC
jgi:hypothetical protein